MTKLFPFLLATTLFLSTFAQLYSQGCSDAGLCSFNFADTDTVTTDELRFSLRLFNTFGIGDEAVSINSTGAEIGASYSGFNFLAKIPFTLTSGNLGSTAGLGDLTFLLSKEIYSHEDFDINLAGGFKVATNDANILNEDDLALPMVYQTSQGTNDVLLLAYSNVGSWVFSTGIQIPLNRNDNTFISSTDPNEYEYYNNHNEDYVSSSNFRRGTDVMLKIEKYFDINDEIKLMVGVLPIYRITESKYKKGDVDVEIEDSDGTTFNVIGGLVYNITDVHTLGLNLGFPVVTRDIRADGLTRAFVVNLDFMFDL